MSIMDDTTPTVDLDARDAQILDLQQQNVTLRERINSVTNQLNQARSEHREDITVIGEALKEEAIRRDWCSDYDDVVDALAGQLHMDDTWREATTRERDYSVTVQITTTVTVSASSEDAARDMVDEDPGTYINYSDLRWSYPDVEVTDVEEA